MKLNKLTTAGALLSLCIASSANAFVFNGSEYSIVEGTPHSLNPHAEASFSWTEAKADAEAQGGHLATFGDAAEWNAVVAGLGLDGSTSYWLGGSQSVSNDPNRPNDADWSWVDGTTWDFTAWANNEPNDYGWGRNSENYLETWANGSVWNDSSNGSEHYHNQGYILEVAQVPEPASLALLGLGLAGLGFARRKQSQA